MALPEHIMELVKAASQSGEEMEKTLAQRRGRRRNAILAYQPDDIGDIDACDLTRDEMDFIQRIEAYTGADVSRFAEIVGAYLSGTPASDQKRITDNLTRLRDAVVNNAAWREVYSDLLEDYNDLLKDGE